MTTKVATVHWEKDNQLITEDGTVIRNEIEGLKMRPTPTIEDHRGELVEMFRESWDFHPDPLVYSYFVSLRPKSIRGWVVHEIQDDRIFVASGVQLWAFFDNREDSPTYRTFAKYVISDKNRTLFVIPKGVIHAVQNIGTTDALFVNMPNKPYNRKDPDKYRIPLKNDLIPFDFSDYSGK
jgi:dTDP-4-dehydrorhamnose 3,5-epimerase